MYIPPQGIHFRLVGYVSQHVLHSRDAQEPQVGLFSADLNHYTDQYFTLVVGAGPHQGTYLIKSKQTGKVLFSRTDAEPYVWHTDSTSYPDDK